MEVIFGLCNAIGYSEEELFAKRKAKAEKRGAFKKGIVLERVYED